MNNSCGVLSQVVRVEDTAQEPLLRGVPGHQVGIRHHPQSIRLSSGGTSAAGTTWELQWPAAARASGPAARRGLSSENRPAALGLPRPTGAATVPCRRRAADSHCRRRKTRSSAEMLGCDRENCQAISVRSLAGLMGSPSAIHNRCCTRYITSGQVRSVEQEPLVPGEGRIVHGAARGVGNLPSPGHFVGAGRPWFRKDGPQQMGQRQHDRRQSHGHSGAQRARRVGLERDFPPQLIGVFDVFEREGGQPTRGDDDGTDRRQPTGRE